MVEKMTHLNKNLSESYRIDLANSLELFGSEQILQLPERFADLEHIRQQRHSIACLTRRYAYQWSLLQTQLINFGTNTTPDLQLFSTTFPNRNRIALNFKIGDKIERHHDIKQGIIVLEMSSFLPFPTLFHLCFVS